MNYDEWWYAKKGMRNGPISFEEIQIHIVNNEITPETYAWCPGMEDWMPIKDISRFKETLDRLPPPLRERPDPVPWSLKKSVIAGLIVGIIALPNKLASNPKAFNIERVWMDSLELIVPAIFFLIVAWTRNKFFIKRS